MRRGNDAFMLMDAMSEPVQSRSRPQFDRPLRRMVWLVPASLCLWILILAGFALLLGNPVGGPSAPPLEVSLTDLGHGAPGGSPGGGPGTQGSGGGLGIKPIGASLPAAQSAAPRAVAPSGKHPVMTLSRPPVTFAVKPRRKRLPKPPMRIDEDAFARFRPPARTAAEKQVDADETAAWLQRRAHEPAAVPLTPLSAATQAKPAARTGSAIASLGGADAAPASGSGGGVSGSGASAGDGSGGQGAGTGGGIGNGSQAFATVEHPPVPISRVLPLYPGAARAQGVEGEVVLRAIVDQRGAVERDIVVVESIPVLDQAAIEALRQWRFEPGRDAGNRAVRVVIEVPLRFRLQ
jgi:protein TonB